MKLQEYQAKELFRRHNIPVLKGKIALTLKQAEDIIGELGLPLVVKAQLPIGGRGKAGLIKLCRSEGEVKNAVSQLIGREVKGLRIKKLLLEEAFSYNQEFYLGFTVDRKLRKNCLIFSKEGGMEIEEVALKYPQAILRLPLGNREDLSSAQKLIIETQELNEELKESLKEIISSLFDLYREYDCLLAEINPLAVGENKQLVALDAKLIIDDNALFRQPQFKEWEEDIEENSLEAEAHKQGLAYVKLKGEIGIIGNGAGLVMATMDMVRRYGGNPANFLDIGGGAKQEVMQKALELLLKDREVKGLFINIFGGITRCDEVARGIIAILSQTKPSLPIVVRLTGTRCEQAKALLDDIPIYFCNTMQEGAERIVSFIKDGNTS